MGRVSLDRIHYNPIDFKILYRHRYWSKLNGDGEFVWGRTLSLLLAMVLIFNPLPNLADPQLTSLGVEQARVIQDMWKIESLNGLPPHKFYCSPLSRALHTCDIMRNGVFQNNDSPVTIVEVSDISISIT